MEYTKQEADKAFGSALLSSLAYIFIAILTGLLMIGIPVLLFTNTTAQGLAMLITVCFVWPVAFCAGCYAVWRTTGLCKGIVNMMMEMLT